MQHPELTAERRAELVELAGGWEDLMIARGIVAYEALVSTLEAEVAGLADHIEIAAVYLDALGDNLLRNDADMQLDDCRDPKDIARDLRAALSPETSKTDGER